VANTIRFSPSTQETFWQFAARQWAEFGFETLDTLRCAFYVLAWRYGCLECNAKRFRRTGRGLLCARHFGRLRRDLERISEFLAKEGF
jgi:hypothetical protein